MSWFWFSIIALLCWSGSDFFSKIGCRDSFDKYSQFKMVMAVGVVMGLHAAYEVFIGGVEISWSVIWTYLPVSLLYIGSMTLGYVGLRYIELSISSPICNASGALVAIIAIISGTADIMAAPQYLAIVLACAGVIGLGFVGMKLSGLPVRRSPTTSMPRAGWHWLCPSPTVCWTPPAPLPMIWCWKP